MDNIKIYKIKDKDTGLYSTGGMEPSWTKRGKTWNQINFVKIHLRQFCSDRRVTKETMNKPVWEREWENKWANRIPLNWLVVELSTQGIVEVEAHTLYPKTEE